VWGRPRRYSSRRGKPAFPARVKVSVAFQRRRAISDVQKNHVNPAAGPRSVEHAALGAQVRRTRAHPPPP
jgi:hypothetical protein